MSEMACFRQPPDNALEAEPQFRLEWPLLLLVESGL
jgi:hypothetical protein